MKILAHRGYWNDRILSNSLDAIRAALEKGYGFESDIRDYQGQLVISHNMADAQSPDAETVFQMMHQYQDAQCFAINVKADDLKQPLMTLLKKYQLENYFTFDMSFPQMLEYRAAGLRYFTRQSEYEAEQLLYSDAAGVWVDGFESTDWITEELISNHQKNGKTVCLVSPDLHHREYLPFWEWLRQCAVDVDAVMLCTDYPDEARAFFSDRIEATEGI